MLITNRRLFAVRRGRKALCCCPSVRWWSRRLLGWDDAGA
jgi:hypothetical protein